MSYITHCHSWEHIPPEFAHLTAQLSKTPRSTEQIGRKCSFYSSECYKNTTFEVTMSDEFLFSFIYFICRKNMLNYNSITFTVFGIVSRSSFWLLILWSSLRNHKWKYMVVLIVFRIDNELQKQKLYKSIATPELGQCDSWFEK